MQISDLVYATLNVGNAGQNTAPFCYLNFLTIYHWRTS